VTGNLIFHPPSPGVESEDSDDCVSGISVSREQSEPVVSEENSVADTEALSAVEDVEAADLLASGDGKRTAEGQPSQSQWVNVEPNFSRPKNPKFRLNLTYFKGTPGWL